MFKFYIFFKRDQEKARNFKDFEEEWVALCKEWCIAAFQPE